MCFSSGPEEATPAPRPSQRPSQFKRRGQDIPLQRLAITGPVTPPGQIPAPERDAAGLWVQYEARDLDRSSLLAALAYVAEYLDKHGEDITLVAVGGAVNTILLRSRMTTYDVDFFCHVLSGSRLRLIREAGQYAVQRSAVPMSTDWLNNATARMPGVVENVEHLVDAALAQREILFQRKGLTVAAAPWNYAFIKKISRITQGTARTYDASDAVAYLHRHITRHGGQPVPFETMQEWGSKYKALSPVEILREIDDLYRRTYGRSAILFDQGGRRRGH
ncbi:hypothetical protein PgNI_10156 [Pyricularia grisea]|uniref:DUF7582 domain-containing protein n=1 Tax=Pyricularia grisea TaxID=148305 RepID=A0A6P8B026_PYRGI|nr:hypothetical protein PgNI_10156 [Pyricularia grisea]TLD07826.1 hypothetical protein PgNI_10156 [Pyricularia grisea]